MTQEGVACSIEEVGLLFLKYEGDSLLRLLDRDMNQVMKTNVHFLLLRSSLLQNPQMPGALSKTGRTTGCRMHLGTIHLKEIQD